MSLSRLRFEIAEALLDLRELIGALLVLGKRLLELRGLLRVETSSVLERFDVALRLCVLRFVVRERRARGFEVGIQAIDLALLRIHLLVAVSATDDA